MGQLDDVGHADLTRQAVVAQRGTLVVEATSGVSDAALDRHRQVATVTREPVAQHLGRLVGALQHRVDHGTTALAAGGDVLGRHHDRGRTHEHLVAQVRREPSDEGRIRPGHRVDELDEPCVTCVGALVERVLAHHVGRAEQEQLRLRVASEGVAALEGARALVRGRDRCGQVGTQRTPLGARELRHVVHLSLLCVVGRVVDGSGQGTWWTSTPSRTAGPKASYAKKNACPSQLTGVKRSA